MAASNKKNQIKKFKKAFKSIDKFMEIKEIFDDGILLKNNTIVKGIKLAPFDIWTCQSGMAEKMISTLRYAFNQFDFPVYQCLVYSPSSFEELSNSLRKELEDCSPIQNAVIIDDIEKLEEFSSNNKKVEFFLFIKHKNPRILQKWYSVLMTELSRAYIVKDCGYLDYLTYINWLFDLNDNFLTSGYYKGRAMSDSIMTDEEVKEIKHNIDMEIMDEKNMMEYEFKLFDIQEHNEYFKMNDKYYHLILIRAFPSEFDVGILNYVGRNQNIKTFFMTQKSELDLVKHVRKENKDLRDKLKTAIITKDLTREEELRTKINSLELFANEMVRNRDKTLDMSAALVISHTDYKEMLYIKKKLTDELRNLGFTVFSPKMLQLALFKYMNPIFAKDNILSETLEFNIGFPMSTTSFALTYPYHFSTNEDKNGFLYAYEMNMKGRILFNPRLYREDEDLSVMENRLTGNIILLGDTGSGKSTDLYLLYRYFIRRNWFIMWIDPENKNRKETINNGGTYLEFGNKENMFNLFQLTRVSSDEDDPVKRHHQMWDSDLAVTNAIDTFKNVLILYTKDISDNTLSMVGMVAQEMYRKFGFLDSIDENGITVKAKYPSFENLKNTDFPTLSDFAATLSDEIQLYEQAGQSKIADACTDLLIKINPMLSEHKYMFDGYTTINIDLKPGNIIGIGTKRLYTMSANLRDALQYIIYVQAFNYCLDDSITSAFMFDEAHTTMTNKQIISLLNQFTRRNRKYDNINVLATQEPLDFSDKEQEAIFNQSTYIIVKRLAKDNSLKMLQRMVGIDERDIRRISTFNRGDSYFVCGSKSYFMHTLLTVKEEQSKGNNYSE